MKYNFEIMANRKDMGNTKQVLESNENIVLSGAEMDYSTAPVICDALEKFSRNGMFGYTAADDQYYHAIITWMKKVRSLSIEKEDIVVTHGTIYGLNTAIRTFSNEGDGIIIQHPSFHHYDKDVIKNKRVVVSNRLLEDNGKYSIDFFDLEEKMKDPNNKLFILCNPHNPTGKVFSKDELLRIASLANNYNVIVYSDEIFGEISFEDNEVISYLSIDPIQGIVATSLGKCFNLTGVNHANIFIKNKELREKYIIQKNREHFGSIDPFFYISLTSGYSEEGFQWIQAMKQHTWQNYISIKEYLKQNHPELILSPLEGGFVIWINFKNWHFTDEELYHHLENNLHIIADPGTVYNQSQCYRFNIATPYKNIEAFLNGENRNVVNE